MVVVIVVVVVVVVNAAVVAADGEASRSTLGLACFSWARFESVAKKLSAEVTSFFFSRRTKNADWYASSL